MENKDLALKNTVNLIVAKIKYGVQNDETNTIMSTSFTINNVTIIEEEKMLIIDYLKNINASINILLFRLALKRYLNGGLKIEKAIKKTL